MLHKYFKDNKLINFINKSVNSKLFMLFIVLLALLSNLFGIELIVYSIYAFIVAIVALFSVDFLPTLPIAVVSYMTFSKANNPRGPDKMSIFLDKDVQIYFMCICIFIGAFAISRIIHDFIIYKERRKFPKLLFGFMLLGFSFFHGGAYSDYYEFRTSIYGIVEILALSFTYLVFYYTVDFKKVNKLYWAELFCAVSIMITVEIFYILYEVTGFNFNDELNRGDLWTGWGQYNNVGGIAIMCLPSSFYLATQKKHGWIYCLIGHISMLGVGLSMSRNSMLAGFSVYVIMLILVAIFSKGKERIKNLFVYLVCLFSLSLSFTLFFDQINNLFASIFDRGADDSGRFEIYIEAIGQFESNPIFGVGFYECGAFQWGEFDADSFLPARYHSTIIQLLACTGVFGLIAYSIHRFETIKLLVKNFNISKLFIWLSILVFLLSSLFDCFFFNFGPGFLYSALLLFLERQDDLIKSA